MKPQSKAKFPAAAQRWLDHSVPDGAPSPQRIWVGQSGALETDGRWLTWKGTGTYESQPLSYDWRARLKIKLGVWLLIKDGHAADVGWGGAWLYGLKSLGQKDGPDVLVTQVIRNLAELAWVPDLARAEPDLRWTDAGDDAFEIRRMAGEREVTVRFDVNADGDVVRASSPFRPYDVPEGYAEAPWHCEFSDHREFGDVRVPSRVVAIYDQEDGPWEYFRGEVTSINRDDGSQAASSAK